MTVAADRLKVRGGVRASALLMLLLSSAFLSVQLQGSAPASAGSDKGVDVYGTYSAEPAPMGIADYGMGPAGPYEYATSSVKGIALINSLTVLMAGSPGIAIFQLNINLQFSVGGERYVYWVQDIAFVDTATDTLINVESQVWNESAPSASMGWAGITGGGGTAGGFYRYSHMVNTGPGNHTWSYPEFLALEVNATLNAGGVPQLVFSYANPANYIHNEGFIYGYQMVPFDRVTFSTRGSAASVGFEVNGFNLEPGGGYYDSEFVLVGQRGGPPPTLVNSQLDLQLEYWNGHNYQMVKNAYNFGGHTGETIQNAVGRLAFNPQTGTLFAELEAGNGGLGILYDESKIGVINVTSPLSSGFIFTNSNPYSYIREFDVYQWNGLFVNGNGAITVYPGNYTLALYQKTNVSMTALGSYGAGGLAAVEPGYELDLRTPLNGAQSPPRPLVHELSSGPSGFPDQINSIIRPMTQPLGDAIDRAFGGSSFVDYLFVEQPTVLVVLVVALLALAVAAARRLGRDKGAAMGKEGAAGGKGLIVSMVMLPVVVGLVILVFMTAMSSAGTEDIASYTPAFIALFAMLVMSEYGAYRRYRRTRTRGRPTGLAPSQLKSPVEPERQAVAPASAGEESPGVSLEALDKLAKIKSLLDSGAITPQEFERLKGSILSREGETKASAGEKGT